VKSLFAFTLAVLFLVACAAAQNDAPKVAARTDLYHVHFAKASLGKAAEEANYLKTPDPNSPMPNHMIVLRHQDGDDWDYVVIEHLGTSSTLKANPAPPPPGARELNAWHTDTFVNGPSWPDFVKAMGLGDEASKTAGAVYVVSVYRAAPGHRDELEKQLSEPPGGGEGVAGIVLLQHLEGAAWHFLGITRYNSWQDFATGEGASVAMTNKGQGGWARLRDVSSYHTDTIADRIAP
jgi:hypothetical protein